jgi:hypothetical protein
MEHTEGDTYKECSGAFSNWDIASLVGQIRDSVTGGCVSGTCLICRSSADYLLISLSKCLDVDLPICLSLILGVP